MTTFPCAIYKNVSPPSQYVYYFFEAKNADDFGFLGWAKYNISREEGDMTQPIETGFHTLTKIGFYPHMPEGIQIIWESISQTPPKGSCKSEIDEHEMRIYKDEELRLTLTK